MYDTLYWEGDVSATDTCCVLDQGNKDMAFEASCSCAVTFRRSECGLPLESVSWTRMCVGWFTVADVRPGPPTRHV